jgi:hypothetical protein
VKLRTLPLHVTRGTEGSNPSPSSEESANFWYLALQRRVVFPSSPRESSDPDYGRYRDMRTGDTDRVQAGGGSASARSMRLGSWVIAKAADAIVDKGRRIAGAMLEAAEHNIEHCS